MFDLVKETRGSKVYRTRAAWLSQVDDADGGWHLDATCYITATVGLKDGGSTAIPLEGRPCSLSERNDTAARKLLIDSDTDAIK